MNDVLDTLTLRQIRYFITVAEAKSFRRASEILHISQPPLTQHVKALEETLGVELFDRSDRQIQLTFAGKELLSSSQNMMGSLNTNLEYIKSIGRGLEGTIRIGVGNDFIYSQVLSQIQKFCKNRPKVLIELHVMISPTLAELLHQNKLDLIFTVQNPRQWKGDFVEHELGASRLVALVPGNHRLSKRPNLSITDLKNETIITYPENSNLPIAMECRRLFRDKQIIPRTQYFTNHVTLTAELVADGVGIALATEHSISKIDKRIAAIPIDEDISIKRVLMHKKKLLHPALKSLIKELIDLE